MKRFRHKALKLSAIISSLTLMACDSGYSYNTETHSSITEQTHISGNVFKGPVSNADIIIYDLNDVEIGRTETNANGDYSITLERAHQGAVRIKAIGGHYIHEATGEITPLHEPLHVLRTIESNNEIINITLLTEIVDQYISLLDVDIGKADFKNLTQKISDSFGLNFDITSQQPLDLLNAENLGINGDSLDYGLVISGIVQLSHEKNIKLSDIISAFAKDLSDNDKLDNIETLNELNIAINNFIRSEQNRVLEDKENTKIDEIFYRNVPPSIESLAQQNIYERHSVELTPRIKDDKGELIYKWEQLSGSPVAIEDVNASSLRFRANDAEQTTQLTFKLTVTDEGKLFSTQQFDVLVNPAPLISGMAFKGPIQGATIKAIANDDTVIGQTQTINGQYQIKNYDLYEGVLKLVVNDGEYISEANGNRVPLTESLRAAKVIEAKDVNINITPLTELALRRAFSLNDTLLPESISQANKEIAEAFSLPDIVHTQPVDLMDEKHADIRNPGVDYALILAGAITSMDRNEQSLTQWLNLFSTDLNDNGVLDNVTQLNQLHLGVNEFIHSPLNSANLTSEETQIDTVFYRNTPPVITPMTKVNGLEGETIKIEVSASDDKGALSYQWEQVSGTNVGLTVTNHAATIELPRVDQSEELVFNVSVTDQGGLVAKAKAKVDLNAYPAINLDLITDEQLRKCVESATYNSNIYTDVSDVSYINCSYPYPNIEQIDGIDQFIKLKKFNIYPQNKITDLTPLSSLEMITDIRISNSTITDISPLKDLSDLKSLDFQNSTSLTDFNVLTNLTKLESINFKNTGFSDLQVLKSFSSLKTLILNQTLLKDIDYLRQFTNIQRLELEQLSLTDISSIQFLTKLDYLTLRNNNINDISPLHTLNGLTFLNLGYNQVDNISTLANLISINNLTLEKNLITDLSPLNELTTLNYLNLNTNQIVNLSPLSSLINLNYLYLDNNQITDLSPLSTLVRLSYLGLGNNTISELSPLSNLANVRYLSLNSNEIINLSPLSVLVNIQSLYLNHNQINDLSPLQDFTRLSTLNISNNQISDLSPLTKSTQIRYFYLANNQINDISVLNNMTNMYYLNISNNPTVNISPLQNLTGISYLYLNNINVSNINELNDMQNLYRLDISNSNVTDISSLSTKKYLHYVYMFNFKGTDLTPLINIKQLEGNRLQYIYLSNSSNLPCSQLATLIDAGVRLNITLNEGVNCQI